MPSIRVINKSGALKTYVVYAEKPRVDGPINERDIWHVFASVGARSGGNASIIVDQQYQAICGTSQDRPSDRVQVDISSLRPVTLGKSARTFTVEDRAAQFDREDGGNIPANAFQSNTQGSFSKDEAQNCKSCVGK